MQPTIIKHRNVRLERKTSPCSEAKTVEILEHEGVVVAIELACSCGEVTVVELEYAEPSPAEPNP
ncbi:MAG: hypothetical protein E2O39_02080 [Planctomycetota bacterium]|nr:MAG: hypothetical protein E2O39_02080 [Planctomycetota bacterium]